MGVRFGNLYCLLLVIMVAEDFACDGFGMLLIPELQPFLCYWPPDSIFINGVLNGVSYQGLY